MTKIACGVGECSHNKAGECYANLVSVAGETASKDCETCCSSFLNQTVYSELTSSTTDKSACECLECSVKTCKHNEGCTCCLDHIKVNGDNVNSYSETQCLSFEAKN